MSDPLRPSDRLRAGYAVTAQATDARRLRRLADGFTPDPRMEQLLALKEENPAAFRRIETGLRMQLGHYVEQKAAHEAAKGGNS